MTPAMTNTTTTAVCQTIHPSPPRGFRAEARSADGRGREYFEARDDLQRWPRASLLLGMLRRRKRARDAPAVAVASAAKGSYRLHDRLEYPRGAGICSVVDHLPVSNNPDPVAFARGAVFSYVAIPLRQPALHEGGRIQHRVPATTEVAHRQQAPSAIRVGPAVRPTGRRALPRAEQNDRRPLPGQWLGDVRARISPKRTSVTPSWFGTDRTKIGRRGPHQSDAAQIATASADASKAPSRLQPGSATSHPSLAAHAPWPCRRQWWKSWPPADGSCYALA